MQLVAAKAVPVTEVVVDKHLKPYVKEHAGGIQAGTKQFTEEELLPRAQQVQDTLPDAVEEFTEDHLKPAVKRLASEIEQQVCPLVLMLLPQPQLLSEAVICVSRGRWRCLHHKLNVELFWKVISAAHMDEQVWRKQCRVSSRIKFVFLGFLKTVHIIADRTPGGRGRPSGGSAAPGSA